MVRMRCEEPPRPDETASGKVVTCEKIDSPAYAVAWRPDGKALASAGFDGRVHLSDPRTGKLLGEFCGGATGEVRGL